ncbi:MAG: hypothetical protein N3F07_00935 [Candidatus Micrarchaeota archaeon]|nr:hypothetical protein [Candidatus Micrarchaeota archaeon]
MKELFLKIKPSSILLLLKDSQQSWYPSKLARASGASYVHTVNLLGKLRKANVVSLEKKGKQTCYRLTEKGAHLALSLDDFSKKCDSLAADSEKAAPQQQPSPQPPQDKPLQQK